MHWPTATALLLAVAIVFAWAAVEGHRYLRGRHLIAGRQLAWRLVVAVLVGGVAGMILWGSYYEWQSAASELLFWSACLTVMAVVILLTLKDWRMIVREQHLRRAQLYRRMDEELRELGEGQPKPGE